MVSDVSLFQGGRDAVTQVFVSTTVSLICLCHVHDTKDVLPGYELCGTCSSDWPERKLLVLWKVPRCQVGQAFEIPACDPFRCMLEPCTTQTKHRRTGLSFFPDLFKTQVTQALDFCEDVLVINRARLLRDTYFTLALNAMKHRDYPPLGEGLAMPVTGPFGQSARYFCGPRAGSEGWDPGSQAQLHQPKDLGGALWPLSWELLCNMVMQKFNEFNEIHAHHLSYMTYHIRKR